MSIILDLLAGTKAIWRKNWFAVGIPYGSETSILGYRKDIFEKHGLSSETYDEMLDLACRSELEPMGDYRRGQHRDIMPVMLLLHLAPLGGRIFDDQWKPIVNNAAGVAAAQALKKMLIVARKGHLHLGLVKPCHPS